MWQFNCVAENRGKTKQKLVLNWNLLGQRILHTLVAVFSCVRVCVCVTSMRRNEQTVKTALQFEGKAVIVPAPNSDRKDKAFTADRYLHVQCGQSSANGILLITPSNIFTENRNYLCVFFFLFNGKFEFITMTPAFIKKMWQMISYHITFTWERCWSRRRRRRWRTTKLRTSHKTLWSLSHQFE